MSTIREIAKMIDHSILSPLYTDEDLIKECAIAKQYDVASVCVKPYAVKLAVEQLKGSDVLVGCVIGFPAGNSAITVKAFETEQACKDGAVEIDMVINIGKALQEDWIYLEEEIKSVVDTAHKYNSITKVIFETDYITKDQHKIKLCEICSKAGAEFVKTSTGFGFVKGADGKFSYTGATAHDLALMRKYSAPNVRVKASGGVRTLSDLLKFKEIGISRCGATATAAMLEEAKKLFGASV
ncbi:MAG: deoxyribose-phosphate aldolase [Porphyromonadaceae bacterium]|nr:MAG: deoxyribose-phosphate aldolase [Porphyromonadaceae bacterium]